MIVLVTQQRECRMRLIVEAALVERFKREALGGAYTATFKVGGAGGSDDGAEVSFTDDQLRCCEVLTVDGDKGAVPERFVMVEAVYRTEQWK